MTDEMTIQQPSRSVAHRRSAAVMVVLAIVSLALSACNPNADAEATNYSAVNQVRANAGLPALERVPELDIKARAQADRMAMRARIYHSRNLSSGVTPGWTYIGENVAMAGSIEQAQAALEASAPHYANMTNAAFSQVGIGISVRNGVVYVVQVFVSR